MSRHEADPTKTSEHEADVREREGDRGNLASADARVDAPTRPTDEQLLGEEPVRREDEPADARSLAIDPRVDPAERGGSDTEHHR